MGARAIAVPCVTAHHFYPEMQAAAGAPGIDMLACSARALRRENVTAAALLATRGSYISGAFCRALEAAGVTPLVPSPAGMQKLMELIYGIKAGDMPAAATLEAIAAPLLAQGAQRVILGCTELSLYARTKLDLPYTDPMEILADALLAKGIPLA
jgi:aspartate racemase